jgi:CheY-like chemotaxis protein
VLVVEDDSDTLEMLTFVLSQNGADVVPVDTVPAALEQFERQRPDLVLADIAMAEMDGYDLIAEIKMKDAEQESNTKAVAVTAFATKRDAALALAAGFKAHITKPFDPSEFVETLVNAINAD